MISAFRRCSPTVWPFNLLNWAELFHSSIVLTFNYQSRGNDRFIDVDVAVLVTNFNYRYSFYNWPSYWMSVIIKTWERRGFQTLWNVSSYLKWRGQNTHKKWGINRDLTRLSSSFQLMKILISFGFGFPDNEDYYKVYIVTPISSW